MIGRADGCGKIDQNVDLRQQIRDVYEQADAIRPRFGSVCLTTQPADQRYPLVACRERGNLAAHPAPNAGYTDPQRHGDAPRGMARGARAVARPAPLSVDVNVQSTRQAAIAAIAAI